MTNQEYELLSVKKRRKSYMKNPKVLNELSRIQEQSNGILFPEKVIQSAKSKKSPLHSYFLWNNTKAGHAYRLEQARQLIRVSVEYINNTKEPSRVWVSLSSDRKSHGGYRTMVSVLSDSELCRQMLHDALNELTSIEEKYGKLKELAGVFNELHKIKGRIKKTR